MNTVANRRVLGALLGSAWARFGEDYANRLWWAWYDATRARVPRSRRRSRILFDTVSAACVLKRLYSPMAIPKLVFHPAFGLKRKRRAPSHRGARR